MGRTWLLSGVSPGLGRLLAEKALARGDRVVGAGRRADTLDVSKTEKGQDMPKRDAIFPANRHALYDLHRYSAAIRSGDLLFVSGQVGSREDGSPEPAFEDQVRRAFANLRAVLAAAGCSFDDVVDVTTFHTNPGAQIDAVLAVRAEEIGEPPYPNWTAIGVNWLAGFDFEIKVIARIPPTLSTSRPG